VIDNSFDVLSVQMMAVLQAVDYLDCAARLSTETKSVYTTLRKIFPKFIDDQAKFKDLQRVKEYMQNSETVHTQVEMLH
jgi:histidine ammonia-lyase